MYVPKNYLEYQNMHFKKHEEIVERVESLIP